MRDELRDPSVCSADLYVMKLFQVQKRSIDGSRSLHWLQLHWRLIIQILSTARALTVSEKLEGQLQIISGIALQNFKTFLAVETFM